MSTAPSFVMAFAVATATMSCANFNGLASQVAQGQAAAAAVVRREGALAFTLCRRQAAYTYLESTLKLNPQAPEPQPRSFANWYGQEPAENDRQGNPVAWSSYCAGLEGTGDIYNAGVVALRDYAEAVQSLADAKAFDGSGLAELGGGVGQLAASFRSPSAISSAASDIGSAAASLGSPVVTYLRTRELKKLLTESHAALARVLASLDRYLAGLEDLRAFVVLHRGRVVQLLPANRGPGDGFTSAATAAQAYELASDGDVQLDRFAHHIAANRALVAAIAKTEGALVAAATGGAVLPARSAAAALSASIVALNRQPAEVP